MLEVGRRLASATTAKASLISTGRRLTVWAGLGQQPLDRAGRGRGEPLGRLGEAGVADDGGERGDAALVGLGARHDDQRGRAVVDRRGVAGGDRRSCRTRGRRLGQLVDVALERLPSSSVTASGSFLLGTLTGAIFWRNRPAFTAAWAWRKLSAA